MPVELEMLTIFVIKNKKKNLQIKLIEVRKTDKVMNKMSKGSKSAKKKLTIF